MAARRSHGAPPWGARYGRRGGGLRRADDRRVPGAQVHVSLLCFFWTKQRIFFWGWWPVGVGWVGVSPPPPPKVLARVGITPQLGFLYFRHEVPTFWTPILTFRRSPWWLVTEILTSRICGWWLPAILVFFIVWHRERVVWYSAMLGCKRSLSILRRRLESEKDISRTALHCKFLTCLFRLVDEVCSHFLKNGGANWFPHFLQNFPNHRNFQIVFISTACDFWWWTCILRSWARTQDAMTALILKH